MPRLKDIAARAGTSVSTVSLVLNDRDTPVRISAATRHRVLEAARAVGYTPNIAARRLRSAGNGAHPLVLGVLLPLDERLTTTVSALGAIHRALDARTRDDGAAPPEVIIETYEGGRLAEVRSLRDNTRYNGAILFNTLPDDDRFLAETGPLPVPVVLMQRSVEGHSWVNSDNRRMGGEVAAHLLALGRRRLALVRPAIASAAQTARQEGFAARLREEGGAALPADHVVRGAFSEAGGYEATAGFLRRRRQRGDPAPTALFATTDRMAIGALHALKEAGLRVPADVALVGYDNDPAAPFTDPALTTVDAAVGRGAEEATAMLLDLIHGRPAGPTTKLLEARLIVRASCGARGSAAS
jgi:DNA-binding LacI/PurR family transcriptional regulator